VHPADARAIFPEFLFQPFEVFDDKTDWRVIGIVQSDLAWNAVGQISGTAPTATGENERRDDEDGSGGGEQRCESHTIIPCCRMVEIGRTRSTQREETGPTGYSGARTDRRVED
jgi:hypothetical protein